MNFVSNFEKPVKNFWLNEKVIQNVNMRIKFKFSDAHHPCQNVKRCHGERELLGEKYRIHYVSHVELEYESFFESKRIRNKRID